MRRARAGAGRGRLRPDAAGLPGAAAGALPRARDPLRRRRGAVAASAARGRCGRSSTTSVEPDLLVSGKSLGGGLPLAGVTGRPSVMDAVAPGGLGGTFGGNPVACAAAVAVLDEVADAGVPRAAPRSSGETAARAPRRDRRAQSTHVGEVRGLGPMLALELVATARRRSRRRARAGDRRGARERGLVLLSCGMYGNVIRRPGPARRSPTTSSTRGLDDPGGVACRCGDAA